MVQRRRVPSNNTTLFVEATPRGLVDVENAQEFMDRSPLDFMDALNRANVAATIAGHRFVAVRVPIPDTLGKGAPDAVVHDVAFKLAHEAWNNGRVDKIAGERVPIAETNIYLILPEKINDHMLSDNRGLLPCPSGFLEATPQGFVGVENPREFLEEAPAEFLAAYEKAEKENPGRFMAMRVTVPNGMTEAEAVDASIDAAWKASRFNSFAGRRIDRKEDLALASNVYVQKPAIAAPGASGTKKANKKKAKRAAAGGGIAGSHNPKE